MQRRENRSKTPREFEWEFHPVVQETAQPSLDHRAETCRFHPLTGGVDARARAPAHPRTPARVPARARARARAPARLLALVCLPSRSRSAARTRARIIRTSATTTARHRESPTPTGTVVQMTPDSLCLPVVQPTWRASSGRDAAAAQTDTAVARADGAADRAKIDSLRIPKVAFLLARTHARTRALRGAAPPPGRFRGDLACRPRPPPRARAAALARSLACSPSRAVAERAVAARAVMSAAAATDDARGDGRGDYPPPPHPPQARALVSSAPPRKITTASPPRALVFCSFSRPLSRRARWRDGGTPIIRPFVRMTAHCARAARDAPPPRRARASETETAQRRHSDTTTRRRQLGVAGRSRSAAPHRTAEPEPEPE